MRMGNAIYAAIKPITQITQAINNNLVVIFFIRVHAAANLGSTGQVFRVEYNCHPDNNNIPPEIMKIQILYSARLLKNGN